MNVNTCTVRVNGVQIGTFIFLLVPYSIFFLCTFIPSSNCEVGLEVGVELLESGESVIGTESPIVVEVVVGVQALDLEAVFVQAREAEHEVGAGERVNVLHVELAQGPTVDGPRPKVAHHHLCMERGHRKKIGLLLKRILNFLTGKV